MSAGAIYYGPSCRCGSGRTSRVGDSALLRQCHDCGETFAFRVTNGRLIPMAPLSALALDEYRSHGTTDGPDVAQGRALSDAEPMADSTPLKRTRLSLVE